MLFHSHITQFSSLLPVLLFHNLCPSRDIINHINFELWPSLGKNTSLPSHLDIVTFPECFNCSCNSHGRHSSSILVRLGSQSCMKVMISGMQKSEKPMPNFNTWLIISLSSSVFRMSSIYGPIATLLVSSFYLITHPLSTQHLSNTVYTSYWLLRQTGRILLWTFTTRFCGIFRTFNLNLLL